jgi:hypothetical protein
MDSRTMVSSRSVECVGGRCVHEPPRLKRDRWALNSSTTQRLVRLTQERFEDLVNEIRGANMENAPAHIRFTSSTNMQARTWDGRLRDVDAVLTWTVDARSWGRDGSLVVSKDEFRILAKRSWFSRSSRKTSNWGCAHCRRRKPSLHDGGRVSHSLSGSALRTTRGMAGGFKVQARLNGALSNRICSRGRLGDDEPPRLNFVL